MILGLTGSLGSGKSFVSSLFRELGVPVIDADLIAREVVAPGTEGLREVAARFGSGILTADGSLDRKALARIVFADPAELRSLEAIIHPRVRAREEEQLLELAGEQLVVLDIPLLFEVGAETMCDKVAVVAVDDAVRVERLVRDRGMTPEDVAARLATQMPQAEKVRRADFVIENSGSREDTRRAVERLHRMVLAAATSPSPQDP